MSTVSGTHEIEKIRKHESKESHNPSGSKKRKINNSETNNNIEPDSTTSDMSGTSKLPGTAMEQGGSESTGGENAGLIERPISTEQTDIRVYRKVHRFLTFGLAYKPIAKIVGAHNDVYMITPLAEIPWDRTFMYLNPSEFALLPEGSTMVSMHIKIFQRNVRVAFPTNGTASNLATLNQNKNIVYSVGLNKKYYGINVEPTTFDTNQPMITTDFTSTLNYQQCVDEWYGVPNNDTTAPDSFFTNTPRHQFGQPWPIQNYYALVTQDNEELNSGWPCLQEGVTTVDADLTAGTCILEKSYTPKIGILKPAVRHIYTGLPSGDDAQNTTKRLINGMGIIRGRDVVITQRDGTVLVETESPLTKKNLHTVPLSDYFTITQRIEKSQFISCDSIPHDINYGVNQPSIHIGVQPTHALTTSAILNEQSNNSFTDTQAYWEVVCEARVQVRQPTYRPLAQLANTQAGTEMWYIESAGGTPATFGPNSTMYRGLYNSN